MAELILPKGLKKEYGGLFVQNGYRASIEFDAILPGDLLTSRSRPSFYFVNGRGRDQIFGWHFSMVDRSSWGGWGIDGKDYSPRNFDRIAPTLVIPILEYYRHSLALHNLQEGLCKVI
ncbi:hypothetical protein A3A14_02640 [Candidatus Daviesbacteria bacterium RIFCSPLOWO2_01_FULL_43_38]|uniref:Uncharacterized protein n=3 Tax=Candidatus Daviesiibacteriota TaxID=1752718 RepID=A0A1F5K4A6_9BACT|nr:MAG: hypothetical protein UV33_C0038G0005 [Candidatus Daviesbacteria bacterium GW2011_GWA1_42_6]KKS71077.1 MAG: hypothetical protein UV41_C0006G0029 [Candidatus Daviesbacteria bacterium GW2011_GWA2_42_7]OGE19969.1 MAG: hypothetical protein A2874_00560 [Candidatus Daviesbacteria bacterium RIFCSPHIGHO2_01_FULL_43_17]OGE35719.1 MAG: hypothetical protein A3E45_00245 [Candidatus Daviesbacteria bacterium RIFCSPHIGHO2_12_FULL_43_11]OGE63407.1 MAG: hypothetical protein A3A14_02640 [Candidatus Davies